jgi:hypothetical protein
MCLAIDFDGKPTFKASKIDNDVTQWMLATKLVTTGAPT